ncbi:hypothetical protein COU56_00400 [Candidatus Pacearchaeota archaeon CG10_big_fil_rev_8_21_14_0_10_31_9]|nr:MAG: hypothetical protein AUJ62_01325 [Candidatus Pacearchaeota archaeon CG1_02_32_21]PIN96178.1 MAG: hypothetical protein COU56_00400 [Candidatus Pacearchaeota archaeon CG10_big_fil_rev_8_21_14_0_10_31_9]PIZ83059.1 MAG: hypothetical protein COX97_01840 [Candidatus Pacearchaeota archaeon CG_4_10_14_0_2_um_filter_05_32_18]
MKIGVEDKYPEDFYNHHDILQFANFILLGLSVCRSAQEGNESSIRLLGDEQFFDENAMMRVKWLMADAALKYFKTKEGEKPGHFPMGFESYMFRALKDYAVKIDPVTLEQNAHMDNLALQAYLGGKEFERFHEFSVRKLKSPERYFDDRLFDRLEKFSKDLSGIASQYFFESGGFRRGLVA